MVNNDLITLGHGSGGLQTKRLLDSHIFSKLNNDYLRKADDGAILEMNGKAVVSTDSFVVSPFIFPGGNIGDLAINGTVNDIAMCGGIPKYISLSFILEEGLAISSLDLVLDSINHAANESGVEIVTGDTKVVEKGKGDEIFINTTGIGELMEGCQLGIDRIKDGDSIIVSGNVGTHGIAILSKREGLEFETQLKSDSTNLNQLVNGVLNEFGKDIKFLRDPTRGGVSSTLNEISQSSGLGAELNQIDIPILEEVGSACEMLGLDPLYVANEGIFVAIVSEKIGTKVVEFLRKEIKGKDAALIGAINQDLDSKVVLNGIIGGRRVVHMLSGEQLPRIC